LTALHGLLHTLPAAHDTAHVVLEQALTVLDTALHTLTLHQAQAAWPPGDQTTPWRQIVQDGVADVTAAAHALGQHLRWGVWGSPVVLSGVPLLGGQPLAPGHPGSWEIPRHPFVGLHALPRAGELPALPQDTPDGPADAPAPPGLVQAPDTEDA